MDYLIPKRIAYLHNHSNYSVQDAMPEMIQYKNKIIEMQNTGIDVVGFAVTDHGVMSGLVQEYNCIEKDKECKAKAIYGTELYSCVSRSEAEDTERYHLIVLAKNEEGLKNLYQLDSTGGLNAVGKQKKMCRVEESEMQKYGNGIIASSACLGGIIPKLIVDGKYDKAKEKALQYASYFDEFYLEVQPYETPEQLLVNDALVKMSQEIGLGLIITTDTHFLEKTDKEYHDMLKLASHGYAFNVSPYMKSFEEIYEYCIKYNIPLTAITNTVKIAEECNVDPSCKDEKGMLPNFPCPKGYTEDTYLRRVCYDNFFKIIRKKHFKDIKYRMNRLNYELDVVTSAGFSGYFLILWEWFDWCKQNDILMGTGRGSAAGSLICYLLNITTIDPVNNKFVFERFLSKERQEFPDIDSDVSQRDRAKAIQHLLDVYGEEYVCQIITYSKYKFKGIFKACISAYIEQNEKEAKNKGVLNDENQRIANGLMTEAEIKNLRNEVNICTKNAPDTIANKEASYDILLDCYNNPTKYDISDSDRSSVINTVERAKKIFVKFPKIELAVQHLNTCYANTGIHAGGVIIASKKLAENCPLIKGSKTAILPLVQIEMQYLDFYKLLKIDVLGLSELTKLHDFMELAHLPREWYDSEDFSDPKVYELLRKGFTTEVFQMASYSATKMVKNFKVSSIEDISAVNAGNRPGPLAKNKNTGKSMVDLYQENKASGIIPSLDKRIDYILKDTYGCMWYQEQLMSIGMVMAGYSLGNSDLRIRKPLGKKKTYMMPEIRNEFVYGKSSIWDKEHKNVISISQEPSPYCVGAIARGYTEKFANEIFDSMVAFAEYCFNKAHSFCYGVYAYKTAQAWVYYPCEFAIACMKSLSEQKKINDVLRQAKKLGVDVLQPDIRYSGTYFSVDNSQGKKNIRYGLSAIKGVGVDCINYIEKVRDHYVFNNFDQFYNTIHDPGVIEKFSESYNKSGAKMCPVKKTAEVPLIKAGAFDGFEPNRYKLLNHYLFDIKKDKTAVRLDESKYCKKYKLKFEEDTMGTYVSEQPLDGFPYVDLTTVYNGAEIEITGVVKNVTIKDGRNGKFANVRLEDKEGNPIRAMFFGAKYTQNQKKLKAKEILIIRGKFNSNYNNINVSKCTRLYKQGDVIRLPDDEDGIVDLTQQQKPTQVQMPTLAM